MVGVQELALLAGIGATATKEEGFLALGDGRQIKELESTLLQQVASQIVLVDALHNQNNACRLLVVGARKQGCAIPLNDPLPHGFRHGVARFHGIINDDQVAAEPGERPID